MSELATGRSDGFLPIEDYGLIGNLKTRALVGRDGSVDWFPSPHQESSSVFAALLDGVEIETIPPQPNEREPSRAGVLSSNGNYLPGHRYMNCTVRESVTHRMSRGTTTATASGDKT